MAGIIGDYQYIEFSAESKDAYLFPGRFCSKLIDRKKGKIVNVAIGKDVTVKARNRCERIEKGTEVTADEPMQTGEGGTCV